MGTFASSTPPPRSHDVLERITLQMASSLDIQIVRTTITQGLVDELEGAFARIRLLGPGDLCLHLEASAGLYTNLNGVVAMFGRLPLSEREPLPSRRD